MKLWIVMCLTLIVIVVGGLSLQQSILKTTESLSRTLDSIKAAVRDNQWQEALKLRDEVDEQWREQQQHWAPFIHNHDLNVVIVHLARLKTFLEGEERSFALTEIAEMEIQLVQLYEQEVLTLENIF